MTSVLQQKSQTNMAVITVNAQEGGQVNAAQVTFSFYPDASASFTVQVLNREAAVQHFDEIAQQVSGFALEMFKTARVGNVPIWPATA